MTTLTMKDEKRLDVIQRVVSQRADGGTSRTDHGTERTAVLPSQSAGEPGGSQGSTHGNHGRPCKRKTKEKTVKWILELARGKYQGFNDHHLTEKLKEQEQISLSREMVRRTLRAHGIGSPKKRRGLKHRSRRDRRAAEGMMLQVDGSPHDWLEGLNKKPTTEVGRALEELGVTLILAHSPQAKGRIERLWNTFQDRLVSELRLAKAKTLEQAQALLERYLPEHNRRFAKPAKAEPAWRKVSALQIERALCFKQQRTVAKDNTMTFEGTVMQIPKTSPFRSYANRRVDVHVLLAGAVEIFYKARRSRLRFQNHAHTWPMSNGSQEGGIPLRSDF